MGRKSKLNPGVEFWLGAMPDLELASLSGVYQSTVSRWRIAAGLPRFSNCENTIRNETICCELLVTQNAAAVARWYKLTRERVRAIAEASGLRRTWTRAKK